MRFAFKYRLYPTKAQIAFLNGELREACSLYDAALQGAGHIKVKLHRALEGTIETVTVRREANHWFVCFSVRRFASPLLHTER